MTNPLLAPSPLPYGVPPFAGIGPPIMRKHEAGLAGHLAEIQAIVDTPDRPPSRTRRLPWSGGPAAGTGSRVLLHPGVSRRLGRIRGPRNETVPSAQPTQDEIYLNRGLFERFAAIDTAGWSRKSVRLVEEYLKEFRQSGIQLDGPGQERLKAINAELSRLGTEFGQRVKEGMKSAALLLDHEGNWPACRRMTLPAPPRLPVRRGMKGSSC